MKFNYNKLKGKITEKYQNQKNICKNVKNKSINTISKVI